MLSRVWEKRSIPLYWQLLDKKGCSNIDEQKALITPVLELLSDYKVIVLGDRKFGSVKLAPWLCQKQVKFIRSSQTRAVYPRGKFRLHPLV